jgi:4-amino-4-deoxy-L-arabinose transferase-like glycosyltransferase
MTSLAASERIAQSDARPSVAERFMAAIERSHARACAVLLLLSLACFLPGFSTLQPMDRDEPRYAQASKQMLESLDLVDIRFQDEARHKKPVGIYWMQTATVAAADALGVAGAHTTIALYRLPSLLGALATVVLTYWAALAFVGRRGAFLAAAFMAASIILMVEARLAKTDAMLTACSVAAMGALARAYFGRGAGVLPLATRLAFWLGVALGILVKGPMVLMFAGTCALVLSYREKSLRWLLGLRPKEGVPLTLALVLPWFVAIAWKSGGDFFAASVGQDMLAKVGSGQERHGGPPGFYLAAFFATFWPAAILAAIAAPFAWIHRREDHVAFALAWIVPSWIIFEVVPTKLPHYVMPLYPAIAIITVMAIGQRFVGPHRPAAKLATILIPFIPVSLLVGLAAAAWVFDRTLPVAGLPFLLAASGTAILAWRQFSAGRTMDAALLGLIASPLLSLGVFGFAQVDLQSLKISPRLASVASTLTCADSKVATLGYREPSLVFLVGTNLEMLETGLEAATFLKGGTCRLVFVEQRFDEAFQAEAARIGIRPALSTRVAGFNINSGRRLDIGAYAVDP